MHICINCKTETTNPKFCSRSCAASFNGKAFPKRAKEGKCSICGIPIPASRSFCSDKCRGLGRSLHRKQSTLTSYDSVKKHRKKVKLKAVEYLGGKCSECGYDKNYASLDFHHIDPSQKDFSISSNSYFPWDTIKTELDKCILLCRNCHGEIHNPECSIGSWLT